jgi:hypothetical protein
MRNNVERAFRVLQTHWAIVHHSARTWHQDRLSKVVFACVIMHIMIVGDERDQHDNLKFDVMGPLVNLIHASI